MRQKLEGFELLRDMLRVLARILIILWVCVMLLVLTLSLISPSGQETPKSPVITFHNAGPCLGFGKELVKSFEVGDPQYICADMETDRSEINLNLYIFNSEKTSQVYIDGNKFRSGPIGYLIVPPLPPGKYWAYISWVRPALVDFEFEVVEKK